jgi:cell division protein FtsB
VPNTTKMTATRSRQLPTEVGVPAPRGPARRFRIPAWILVVLIIAAAGGAGIRPYKDFRETEARLAVKQQEVSLLEQENESLKADARRLQSEANLEPLARTSLNWSRPGEEIFRVTGIPEVVEPEVSTTPPPPAPGPVERLVSAVRRLF